MSEFLRTVVQSAFGLATVGDLRKFLDQVEAAGYTSNATPLAECLLTLSVREHSDGQCTVHASAYPYAYPAPDHSVDYAAVHCLLPKFTASYVSLRPDGYHLVELRSRFEQTQRYVVDGGGCCVSPAMRGKRVVSFPQRQS